jgi:hypothetical protein
VLTPRQVAVVGRRLGARRALVAFESTWLFWSVLLLGMLRYVDYLDISDRPGPGSAIKYALFGGLAAVLVAVAVRSRNWRLGLNAPTILLIFTVVACVPLLIQIAQGEAPDSYSSAFCTTLVYALAAFYDVNGKVINFSKLQKRLVIWLLLLGLIYIGELLLRLGAPAVFPPASGTLQLKITAVLIGIYLTTLARDRKLTIALYAVLVCFEILRPTSTALFCLAMCIPLIFLISTARYKMAEFSCYVLLIVLAIFPFLIYGSESVSNFVTGVEGFVKADALGGLSNTQTRLEVLRLAFERWESSSLFFGEMFSGGTTVFLGSWWLSFTKTGLIAIHSDYIIILVEGGLIGYAAFNLMFVWIIRTHFRWLRRQPKREKNMSPQAIMVAVAIPVAMTVAIICATNPYLQLYGMLLVVWFVLLCSEICKVTLRPVPPQGR